MSYKNKPYSYTYKNKSSRGHRISIKDDIVYIDGKIAPKGYRWFDKNNGATYRVGNNGKYHLHQIHGRDVEKVNKESDYYYKDVPTAQLSEDEPLYDENPIFEFNSKLWNGVLNRYNTENKYNIPTYLPGVGVTKVRTSNLLKGVEIPNNAIDSIAKWTNGDKNKMLTTIGLAAHETSFGKYKPFTLVTKNDTFGNNWDYDYMNKHPYYRTVDKNGYSYIRPTELVNNHNYFMVPETKVVGELKRQGKIDTYGYGDYLPQSALFTSNTPDEDKEYAYREFKKIPKEDFEENPILNALKYFNDNNYGMGSSYKSKVQDDINEIKKDEEFNNKINQASKKYKYKYGGMIHLKTI